MLLFGSKIGRVLFKALPGLKLAADYFSRKEIVRLYKCLRLIQAAIAVYFRSYYTLQQFEQF